MNQQDVEDLLYKAALTQVMALGFRFDDSVDGSVKTRARGAAQKLFDRVRTYDERDADIENAVRVFRLVVDGMITARREVYADDAALLQGRIIGQDVLDWIVDRLCPGFYPFC